MGVGVIEISSLYMEYKLNRKITSILLVVGLLLVGNALLFIYRESKLSSFFQQARRLHVHFDESLKRAQFHDKCRSKWAQELLTTCTNLYTKNNLAKVSFSLSPTIPKIIHQIWLGSEFPEKYKEWQHSWILHHPGWQYKLWQEKDIDEFGLENRDLYDAAPDYGYRSDIARYEILYRIGGLYIDTDFECLQPFDILHHGPYSLYIGLQPLDVSVPQLGIGLIGSIPGNAILRDCIDGLKKSAQQTRITMLATGPLYFTRTFCQSVLRNPGVSIVFPPTYFYPCGYSQQGTDQAIWQRPESFAVHHWQGSWLNKEGKVRERL